MKQVRKYAASIIKARRCTNTYRWTNKHPNKHTVTHGMRMQALICHEVVHSPHWPSHRTKLSYHSNLSHRISRGTFNQSNRCCLHRSVSFSSSYRTLPRAQKKPIFMIEESETTNYFKGFITILCGFRRRRRCCISRPVFARAVFSATAHGRISAFNPSRNEVVPVPVIKA